MAEANIPDDFDYETWSPVAKTTLIEEGLWDVVENGVPQDPSKIPELSATIQVEELSKWRDIAVKDMKALQILQSSLTDSAFRKPLSATSAKDLWNLLQKGNEQANLLRLEKQFEELGMDEGEPVDSYFDRVEEIAEQFRRLKNAKSEYQVIKKVLASLSGSYDGVAPLLEELMDLHKMTFKSLVEFFHGYESVTEEDLLLILKDLRLKSKSEQWCGVCNKNTHNQEECSSIPTAGNSSGARQTRPRIGDCNSKGNQQPAATEAQIDQEEEIEADDLLLEKVDLGDFTDDEGMWMIYGHATNHMTPYEKFFTSLDRTHKAKVGLVDGTVIMAEGRGDVKIMMKEGKKKTINNVLFVPGIKRNVLSVRQMTARGCSFREGGRGECIVCDRTGKEFGETMWVKSELAMRLQVIEGNISS